MVNKLLLLTLLIAGLTSCSKEQQPEPTNTVTYHVECDYCSVYVEDNVWNHTNHIEGRPDAVSQHFNVNGVWNYSFDNKVLDTASLTVYVSPLTGAQIVKASIVYKGKISQLNKSVENQERIELKLR